MSSSIRNNYTSWETGTGKIKKKNKTQQQQIKQRRPDTRAKKIPNTTTSK